MRLSVLGVQWSQPRHRCPENLREHYVLTLRHWVRNLESQAACPVKSLTNPPTGRGDRIGQDRGIPLIQGI
jgi:hypothetical protein